MDPDFARIKGVPLEVILKLSSTKLESQVAQYLKEEFGMVDAWGHPENAKLVYVHPNDHEFGLFRVRITYSDHSQRPFLDFKYLRGFYESDEFPDTNPMRDVLIAVNQHFGNNITGVYNHSWQEMPFPY